MPDQLAESSVNKIAIRYGFWDAPVIDPVQCEHGLIYGRSMKSDISLIYWPFFLPQPLFPSNSLVKSNQ